MARDILIVDDEADIRELIGGLLEDDGYEAREAGDADGALAAIRQRKPSLVILDVWLQGSRMDGHRTARPVPGPGSRPAGRGHFRARHDRDSRGGDPQGRLRLPGKTVQERQAVADGQARARSEPAAQRKRPIACADRCPEHADRRIVGHHPGAAADRAGRANEQPRADPRPLGCRQGTGGASDP